MSDGPQSTEAAETIRIYLLDDHDVVRRGIRDRLESEPGFEVVGESGSAAEATRRIPALRPDVAILDGRLPDGSGIDVCRDVRSQDPDIKALILTSYDDDALFSAIMAGAAGYVLKQVRGNDLVDMVRGVAAGQSTLDPSVIAQVLERVRNGPPVSKELAALTEQEQRIPGADRPRHDQPADRRRALSRREDRQELRLLAAGKAGTLQPHPGRDLRGQARTGLHLT